MSHYGRTMRFVAAGFALLFCVAPVVSAPPDRKALPDIGCVVVTQIPVLPAGKDPHARGANSLPVGSRIVSVDFSQRDAAALVLTAGFHTAGRPDVSFDGGRILFVGRRKAADSLAVWEMNADGTGARRIVNRPEDCDRAIYLSTIYTMDATAPVYQICFSTAPASGPPALYTCRLDGSGVRQITFHPGGAWDPLLLSDGRLVFSVPNDGAASIGEGRVLLTINTDGTDISPFAAVHEPPAWRAVSCETADGLVVYVESDRATAVNDGSPVLLRGGRLVAVRRERSLRTRRVIAEHASGVFCTPSPGSASTLLASYRADGEASYGLCVVDAVSGTRVGVAFDTRDWHEVDARRLAPRRTPAGRSSYVDQRGRTGKLYCLNAYLCDTADGTERAKGNISRIQVIRAVTGADGDVRLGQPAVTEATLGDAPVESDGSFFLELPAKMPFRLRTLDTNGKVLRSMRSWMWVMPREGRGCIGCHEDRELSPPNRQPYAVRQPAHKIGIEAGPMPSTAPARPKKPRRGGKGY